MFKIYEISTISSTGKIGNNINSYAYYVIYFIMSWIDPI